MKKSDIAMVILVASISVSAAFAAVGSLPALKAPTEAVQVDSIDKYQSSIDEPDSTIFNSNAINPTVDINIGGEIPPSGR